MLRLQRTAIAVFVLTSGTVFAGGMGPVCTPEKVTVPCTHAGWDVGIQALYLQPAYNDGGGGYIGQFVSPTFTSATYVDNEARWGWGFKLDGSYHFNAGNDVTVSWYHLNDNTKTGEYPTNFAFFNGGFPAANKETYTLSPKWDAVNIEMAQKTDLGQITDIRLHGGVQFARIRSNTSAIGENTAGTSYSFGQTSKLSAFGARFGSDLSIALGKGLSAYINGAGALLAGTSKINQSFSTNIQNNTFVPSRGSRTTIVPEIDGKLGLNYNYAMAQGTLTLDAGYMWVNYFNALTTDLLDDSDFGLQGPYVGLKWQGEFA